MNERCCTFCVHNPYLALERAGWAARLWGSILTVLFRRPRRRPEGPSGCLRNPQLFCYDVHDSAGCRRSLATARPEFLPCKACSHFAMKGKA